MAGRPSYSVHSKDSECNLELVQIPFWLFHDPSLSEQSDHCKVQFSPVATKLQTCQLGSVTYVSLAHCEGTVGECQNVSCGGLRGPLLTLAVGLVLFTVVGAGFSFTGSYRAFLCKLPAF